MARHVEHLRRLQSEGKLFLAGPFKDTSEIMQILVAESREAARRMVLADPFTNEGIFAEYSLRELVEANEENNYLLAK